MTHDRIIQLIAVFVLAVSAAASGRILPVILEKSDENVLRYTNVSVEGAPPLVAVGTMIGALRGLIVDVLWMKVNIMKEKGLYYEVMADSELITKLQPRFAQVWAFHGHNMAYNISVATHTEHERWEWVKKGIRLVRNEGIKANPNDMILYKELAFWLSHKIEGTADDAHLYYKTEFCREWHFLLGEPPPDQEMRIAWIKRIADAPDTLAEAEQRIPGTKALVELLERELSPYADGDFKLDKRFLTFFAQWRALGDQYGVARVLGYDEQIRQRQPIFRAFEQIIADPKYNEPGALLLAYLRKKVLKEEYNMDPQIMYELTRDLGPIDWRHPMAHSLYWAWLGSERGSGRIRNDDVYKALNTDRLVAQAMQGLARNGRISFDAFSNELPGRFPEPRWIDTIDKTFQRLYIKYHDAQGGGGESFIGFIENFLSFEVRECYRAGETERAKKLYARLDSLFGRGAMVPNNKYNRPLDVFIREETRGHYEDQPHLAPSEVAASLRYAYRMGVGKDNKQVWEDAVKFAADVTEYFKTNEWNAYVNKFGRGRMSELIGAVTDSVRIAFEQVMTDPTLEIVERATIWSKIDQYHPTLRLQVYDAIQPHLARQFEQSQLRARFTLDQLFPRPAGLEQFREQLRLRQLEEEQRRKEQESRDQIERAG